MGQKIFIGSSHEGRAEAEMVCESIRDLELGLTPQLWTTFFDAGTLTFEALEDMLRECCAAVFVIRRDDVVQHFDPRATALESKQTYMPRGNVLVEFGLVAGRLGRRHVALCRVEQAELPSDLAGMTVIDMCPKSDGETSSAAGRPFSSDALAKLNQWGSQLLATAPGIERTIVFHGYTGRWEFELILTRWHGLPIGGSSYAIVNGHLDLFICPEGLSSVGNACGTLSCRLGDRGPAGTEQYMSDMHIFHNIDNVECTADGKIRLTSHQLVVHRLNEVGTAPSSLQLISSGSEPWTFKWTLNPDTDGAFRGEVKTSALGGTEGIVAARRLRTIQ